MSQRFLIIQLADIGDLILSTPAISALREAHPDAHIAVLTTKHAAPILDPRLVDEVITFDKHTFDSPKAMLKPANAVALLKLAGRLHRGHYDTLLFFHHFTTRFGTLKFAGLALAAGAGRRVGLENGHGFFLTERVPDDGFGARHQAQYWLDIVARVGASNAPRPAQVATSPHPPAPSPSGEGEQSPLTWERGYRGEVDARLIALHAGSGGFSLARRWEAEKFAAVADALIERHNAQIVLVGGKSDDSPAVIAAMKQTPFDLTGKTTLPELASFLKECDLFIGADSGVLHLAAAAGVPIVAVFGPSNAAAWSPWGVPQTLVRSAPECSPCSYVGHELGLRNGCAARTCMRMITPEQVSAAVGQMLTTTSRPSPWGGDLDSASPRPWKQVDRRYPDHLHILGIPVSRITYAQWMDLIDSWVQAKDRLHHVCTVNPEMLMIAQQDVNFRNILKRVDLTVPDGVGLLWAARRIGQPVPERVTGSDGVPRIAQEAALRGWKLFLLGAADGVAEKAANILRDQNSGLQIVGTYAGSPRWEEEDRLVEMVNASGADILLVAYGAPEQDKWIARNAPRLNVSMAMGIGGTLDFVAGIIPRAPLRWQKLGLEWLYRLYLQPWRIKRMLRLPRFVLAVLRRGAN
ncbi:MAG: WecB/TagA/CpsF family glycosyltransferase [Chloroflexi bacterium]|uniref:WecB/TagA/CpsF family glycosyltransferase n=1 Tax=Candidatus Flexifilum breve TaxID=3140694 RepID=UPI003135D27D|nr:WecB/TagA/CpsF family glycosyltransferase [Chloroflexota bacterium]